MDKLDVYLALDTKTNGQLAKEADRFKLEILQKELMNERKKKHLQPYLWKQRVSN